MRWLVLLLMVPLGAASKEVEVPCTTWYEGHVTTTDVIVIAEVVQAESEVIQSPGKALLKESCVLRIQEVIGESPKLQSATTVRLSKEHPHDLYEQIDPGWGDYRHLRAGQKAVLLIHFYENDVAIGSDAVIVLNTETRSLPEILRRTGLDYSFLTDAELAVWKAASPRMYPELAARVAYERERREDERRKAGLAWTGWLALGSIIMVMMFAVSRVVRRIK
jgi:hypothetical protein